jgi:hypothetical protein
MSTQLDSDSLTEAARAIVLAYYYGTRQELDATAERLRSLLGWDSFAPDSTTDACEVCDCGDQGWEVFNEDPDTGYLGEIQACDTCQLVPDDDTAAEFASLKGYVVTLRNDRWEVDALPARSS